MRDLNWTISENEFSPDRIELNGSRYLIANGYMGFRGTLEEFGADQLVALNMAGLFDQNGDLWRESVNAPNPFYTVCSSGGTELNPLTVAPVAHEQVLNFGCGIHQRTTAFELGDTVITVASERFVSMKDETLAVMRYSVTADKQIEVTMKTTVDDKVWNINGDHFAVESRAKADGLQTLTLKTLELGIPMKVYEKIVGADNENTVTLMPGKPFTFYKVCGVYWGEKCETSLDDFLSKSQKDFDTLCREHIAVWQEIWENSDVVIEGDEDAQKAMRYSIYHLCSIAPRNTAACGIPARGLSGQVYKGASFWDTEMFMLPFFSFTDTRLAENLVRYRINTLAGAKRKAEEFGYEGAFYAWESQETGDDACSLFNVTDIFTNRPMRTYFKDRQIHISADMVYGLWEYCTVSGDYSLLNQGGLDLMYECLLFFYSYASFKPRKDRFELHSVIGPDEYHENINNNAFTNTMVGYSADAFAKALALAQKQYPDTYKSFVKSHDLSWIDGFREKLYVPQPDENGLIEQFDGYFKLEEVSLEDLKKRIILPNEYWGGGNGIATTTRIIKQADVVMLLNVFRSRFDTQVKKANWEFYEPHTEHGSSLSACAYGIVAAEIGKPDWAYRYFMKTATVDLTGNTKQYVGSLYIGGTHPAANGGSWNTAVFGFGGVSYTDDTLDISPRLPEHWETLRFKLLFKGVRLTVTVTKDGVSIQPDGNTEELHITVNHQTYRF